MRRVAAGALATLAVAGCGGEDRLTAEEYRAQGNAICVDLQGRLAAIEKGSGSVDERGRKLGMTSADGVRRLRALRPPAELDAAKGELDTVLDEYPKVARSADPGARLSGLNLRSKRVLRRLGLDRCAGIS